jgi:hypothetical protein
MTEQRTPDLLSTEQSENHLLCEKLLGWEKVLMPEDNYPAFKKSWCHDPVYAPTFTTWADAGLILEALRSKGVITSIQFTTAGYCAIGRWCSPMPATENIPAAIRAAAIEYVRSEP